MTEKEKRIRAQIFEKVKELYKIKESEEKFIPGETPIRYAGRVFDEKELINLVDSSLDFWLTEGRYTEEFERKILEIKHLTTNHVEYYALREKIRKHYLENFSQGPEQYLHLFLELLDLR